MKIPTTTALRVVDGSDCFDEGVYRALFLRCSPERQERAKRFLRKEDAYRSVIAETLLMYSLKKAGLDIPVNITIEKEYGKPFIETIPLKFNLSHSGRYVACAIDTGDVGVDVERIHDIDRNLAERFFSKAENALLSECNDRDGYRTLFFELWVLKESYIKAIGKGLYCGLDSFSVVPSVGGITMESHNPELPERKFRLYPIPGGYRMALCCVAETHPAHFDTMSPAELAKFLE